jgi:hypothetical protein
VSSAAHTRGRLTRTRRPPSVTSPRSMPVPLRRAALVVAALRAHDPLDLPLHRLVQHRQPVPTASASSPSLARPAIPASDSWTRSGSCSVDASSTSTDLDYV